MLKFDKKHCPYLAAAHGLCDPAVAAVFLERLHEQEVFLRQQEGVGEEVVLLRLLNTAGRQA